MTAVALRVICIGPLLGRRSVTLIGLLGNALMCGAAQAQDVDPGLMAVDLGDAGRQAVATAVFYVSLLSMLAVLVAVSIALRRGIWTAYAVLVGLGLIFIGLIEQAVTGVYWTGLVIDNRQALIFGYAMLTANCVIAAQGIAPTHWLARFRTPFRALAVLIWGIWAAGRAMDFQAAYALFSVVGGICGAFHFVSFSTFTSLQGTPDRLLRNGIWALLSLVLAAAVLVSTGSFGLGNHLLEINRALLLCIVVAFVFFYARNVFHMRADRERAVAQALAEAETRARISEDLLDAERRHAEARAVAQAHRMRLAEASHDLRQPISSLRIALAVLGQGQPPERLAHLEQAFDYLDQLAGSYVEAAGHESGDAAAAERTTGAEAVEVALVLATLQRMFEGEAEARGMGLAVSGCAALLNVAPLALMRVMSNLLANAIRHGAGGVVRLRAERVAEGIALSVSNAGEGDLLFDSGQKGRLSEGSGLGLAIVAREAETAGLRLLARSEGGETCVSVTVPEAKA